MSNWNVRIMEDYQLLEYSIGFDVNISLTDDTPVQISEYSDFISTLYLRHLSNGLHCTGHVGSSLDKVKAKDGLMVRCMDCFRQARGILINELLLNGSLFTLPP